MAIVRNPAPKMGGRYFASSAAGTMQTTATSSVTATALRIFHITRLHPYIWDAAAGPPTPRRPPWGLSAQKTVVA
jgi:hypothetical protein